MTDGTISLTELLRNMDNFQIEVNNMILALYAFPYDDECLRLQCERVTDLANSFPSVQSHLREHV